MLGRTPWWSFMLVAVMVVIGLLGPLQAALACVPTRATWSNRVSS